MTMTTAPEVPTVYEAFARRYQSDPADPACADELRHYSAGWTDAAAVSAADNAALRAEIEQLRAIGRLATDQWAEASKRVEELEAALWVCAEHNHLYFGESHNTVIQARALLSQPKEPT